MAWKMEQGFLTRAAAALSAAAVRRGIADDPSWTTVMAAILSGPGIAADGDETATRPDVAMLSIAQVFQLSAMHRALLGLAVAADLDGNVGVALAQLTGSDHPHPLNVTLALELVAAHQLSGVGREALSARSPLLRWGLLERGTGSWRPLQTICVVEDVIGAILGTEIPDPVTTAMGDPDGSELADPEVVRMLHEAMQAGESPLWIFAPPGTVGGPAARAACTAADVAALSLDLNRRPHDVSMVTAVTAAIRRAALATSCLVLVGGELLSAADAPSVQLLFEAPIPVLIVARSRWNADWHPVLPYAVTARPLDADQRVDLWRSALPGQESEQRWLAGYRLGPGQIASAAERIAATAQLRGREPDRELVVDTIRTLARIPDTGRRSPLSAATFDDLELPDAALSELHRLAEWVDLRDSVIERGDAFGLGGKGNGIAALFTGGPGTGKTLAAHVIADSTGRELMQVDLAAIVDKYIGETEKNLEKVFADAESLNVVLFFDEADALFGRRGEVRDSHDRYANQEVSFLLQRMEAFTGTTILATNLRGNLDPAFARRLHFIVHFPDPDVPTRERLWRLLVQRSGALDPADPIDCSMLAGAVDFAGGDIRNVVLGATFDAAAEGSALGMRHIRGAIPREYAKLGRRMSDLPVQREHPRSR